MQAKTLSPPQLAQPIQTSTSNPHANSNLWGSSDPWSSNGNASQSNGLGGSGGFGGFATPEVAKKEERDPFANIWQ